MNRLYTLLSYCYVEPALNHNHYTSQDGEVEAVGTSVTYGFG